jgi:hypothetical protein
MIKQIHRRSRRASNRDQRKDEKPDPAAEVAKSVGYKRPPKHTRFQPGQSGNPKGRPKGTRNFTTDVKATLKALVKVSRDGIPHRISTQEAALLRLREKALSGDTRALDRLLALAQIYGEEETSAEQLSADDDRILEVYRSRLLGGAALDFSADKNGSTGLEDAQSTVDRDANSLSSAERKDNPDRGST